MPGQTGASGAMVELRADMDLLVGEFRELAEALRACATGPGVGVTGGGPRPPPVP